MFKFSASALTKRNTKVAVVELRGLIHDGGGKLPTSEKGISFMGEKDRFDKAFQTNGLAAVALIINSPGGSPAQSQLLGNYIRQLADEKKVPVYAFVEDVAASGGYWLAAAADKIFCVETSLLGSIGVIANVMNYHEAATKYGVKNIIVTAGENKSKLSPFQPVDVKDLEWLKEHASKLHKIFKKWVNERRGDKIRTSDVNLFDGSVWTGIEAVALGLADGIGGYVDTMKAMIPDVSFIEFKPKKRGLLSTLFTGAQRPSAAEIVDDLIAKSVVRDIHFG